MPNQKASWFSALKTRMGFGKEYLTDVDSSGFQYADVLTTSALVGNGVVLARARQQIYAKYQQMIQDPVVSGALRLHVTAALGGHETSGDLVFIEASPKAKGSTQAEAIVAELAQDLAPLFNRIAMTLAYNAASFGDAYGRLYTRKGKGVEDIYVDEMVLPPLVQPYEQGNRTVVCLLAVGAKQRAKLVMNQIGRVRMPRMIYTPQPLAIEKAWKMAIETDRVDELPVMPALVGGSFLADAETQFDNFVAALQGLVGQRVLDSIDESIFTAQVNGMTLEQQQTFIANIKKILLKSKQIADDAVKSGKPFLGRLRHVLPVFGDKQLVQVQGVNASGGSGGGRAGNIGIEDVLFHAKLLSGALGIDITMLGFADLMSGGLGEGGFFRTSAQAAERSRTLRVALSEFFNHVADVHMMYKHGHTFEPTNRPWQINYFGSISALENERQKTQLDAFTTGSLLVSTMAQAKELNLDETAMAHMFERIMKMDAGDAKLYAKALAAAIKADDAKKAAEAAAQFGGGGGGGFGGPSGPLLDEDGAADPTGKTKPVTAE